MAENTEHVINDNGSTKQGNSGRIAFTQAHWIMSLDFSFPVRMVYVLFCQPVARIIWTKSRKLDYHLH